MASGLKKVFSVLAFHEMKSVVTVQRHFRQKYRKRQPSVRALYKRFVTDDCVCKGKSIGRPSVSAERVEVLWRRMCTSPRCRQHYTSSRHGSERPVQTLIRKFSTTYGRRLNIGLMLPEPLVALTLNFINDKLLFIKLFNWSFSWCVFCKCNLK
jgi:hypothetical protein